MGVRGTARSLDTPIGWRILAHVPYPGSLGQFGWNRCHCSGARRMRCSSSSARYWVTRATSSRSEPAARRGVGGRTTPRWPLTVAREVHGDGQDRGAGAQSERRRPGGQRRALAEELDLDAAPADVAVGEQADDLVLLQRLQRRPPGVRAEGDDLHAQLGAQLGEPVEQLRRVDALDDDRHRIADVGEPASRPLPPAEVRQGEDDAAPRLACGRDVLEADGARCRRRRPAPTATAAGSSRPSSGHRTRTPPGRRRAARHRDHVGLTRRRWRSIIARRCGLAKLAPKPIGLASPLATTPGITRASSEPAR